MKRRQFRPEGIANIALEPRELLSTVAVAAIPAQTITARLKGTFTRRAVAGAGDTLNLTGKGQVPLLGMATFAGILRGVGDVESGQASGNVRITTKIGRLNASLIGPTQSGPGVPTHYDVQVTSSSGRFLGAFGEGTADFVFRRTRGPIRKGVSRGTFTVVIVATIGQA